jgi:glycosyltransferase involved in cell wall biosynthesis
MIHIALVIPTIDRLGGAERQVFLLAKGLLRRGARVSVIALSGSGGDAASELISAGASFLGLTMRKGLADPRGWVRFHRWLQREAPDIVHAHLPHATWMSRWTRFFTPMRLLVDTIHTSDSGTLGRRLGYRWSAWLSDQTTAVSEGVAEAYGSAGMVPVQRLSVLPNGVDVEHFHPDPQVRETVRQQLRLDSEFMWFAAGRMHPVKDYATLLHAMVAVPASGCLVIAGAGELESGMRQLSQQLRLESRVRFLGFQPDVRPWMQAADGFVLSSRWEGLPMSLMEAGACALPAVATDVRGSREIIVDGQTGFLTPPGNAAALSDAMGRLMRLRLDVRREIGNQARQNIVEHFSIESVLDRWAALHHDLLATHPRPARYRRRTRNST